MFVKISQNISGNMVKNKIVESENQELCGWLSCKNK